MTQHLRGCSIDRILTLPSVWTPPATNVCHLLNNHKKGVESARGDKDRIDSLSSQVTHTLLEEGRHKATADSKQVKDSGDLPKQSCGLVNAPGVPRSQGCLRWRDRGKEHLDTVDHIFQIRSRSKWPCGFMLLYPGTRCPLCRSTWHAHAHPSRHHACLQVALTFPGAAKYFSLCISHSLGFCDCPLHVGWHLLMTFVSPAGSFVSSGVVPVNKDGRTRVLVSKGGVFCIFKSWKPP